MKSARDKLEERVEESRRSNEKLKSDVEEMRANVGRMEEQNQQLQVDLMEHLHKIHGGRPEHVDAYLKREMDRAKRVGKIGELIELAHMRELIAKERGEQLLAPEMMKRKK